MADGAAIGMIITLTGILLYGHAKISDQINIMMPPMTLRRRDHPKLFRVFIFFLWGVIAMGITILLANIKWDAIQLFLKGLP